MKDYHICNGCSRLCDDGHVCVQGSEFSPVNLKTQSNNKILGIELKDRCEYTTIKIITCEICESQDDCRIRGNKFRQCIASNIDYWIKRNVIMR